MTRRAAAEKADPVEETDKAATEAIVNDGDGDGGEVPWSEAPDDIRREALRALFVARDIEKRIVDTVNSAIRDRELHAEAQNVVITGETGVGKSEIMKRILAANPERRDPETGNIVRPVLYVDVRNSSTPKAVAQAMLVQLMTFEGVALVNVDELIDSTKGLGVPDLTRRVKTLMMGQGVVAALLDEFHNTVSDNGTDRLNRIANWVRDFAKSKSRSAAKPDGDLSETIVFVLIGTKKVDLIVDPALNDEIASITPYRVKVPRYRYATDADKEAFHELLAEIDNELPFDEHAGLDTPALAEKFHVATFGLLRQLGIIIVKAADLAIEDGSDRVREHHLHDAVELKRGVLESHLMSAEAEGEERRIVENPFKAPELAERKRPSGKRGWKP